MGAEPTDSKRKVSFLSRESVFPLPSFFSSSSFVRESHRRGIFQIFRLLKVILISFSCTDERILTYHLYPFDYIFFITNMRIYLLYSRYLDIYFCRCLLFLHLIFFFLMVIYFLDTYFLYPISKFCNCCIYMHIFL